MATASLQQSSRFPNMMKRMRKLIGPASKLILWKQLPTGNLLLILIATRRPIRKEVSNLPSSDLQMQVQNLGVPEIELKMVCDYDESFMTSEVASTSNYVNEFQTEEKRRRSSLSSSLTYRVDPEESVLVALIQQAKWSVSETSLSGDSVGACDIDYTKIGPPEYDDDAEGCNSVDLEEIIIDHIVNAFADEPDPLEEEEPPQEIFEEPPHERHEKPQEKMKKMKNFLKKRIKNLP